MHRHIVVGLAAGLIALSATGCSPGGQPPTTPTPPGGTSMSSASTKNVDSRGRRTDLQPLTDRFPALGMPQRAVWFSGTVGDQRAPGPTTYWIDAVVTLPADAAESLLVTAGPLEARTLDLTPELMSELPTGQLSGSAALDAALSNGTWKVTAAVASDRRTVVLSALGQ